MSEYESRQEGPDKSVEQARTMADEITQLDRHCRQHGLGGLAQCLALLISQASGIPKWVPAVPDAPVAEPRSRES